MNSLTGSIVRSVFSNAIKSISQRSIFPYSTASINAAVIPTSDEPDKLYKTIEIEMRAYEAATMKSYEKFTKMAAENLGIKIGKCWEPRKPRYDREGLTVLRSRFVHKKHRTQYEVRTYFRFVTFHHMTGSTADTFLEYIERNLPEGVALKITKVAVEKLPSEVLSPPNVDEEPTQGKAQTLEEQKQ